MSSQSWPPTKLTTDKYSAAYVITKKPRIDGNYTAYANPPEPPNDRKKLEETAKTFAENREKPTTADAQKGLKDLPSVVASVDPNGLSQIAPMMYKMLGQIASSSSGSSQSSRKKTIEDAFTGALNLLANKYTFEYLTDVFNNALKDNAIRFIDYDYRQIVKNAIANLYKNYTLYGEGNLPVYTASTVTTIGTPPSPVVTVVPDLYVQQYYTQADDPYPGYIKWVSQDGETIVYTERKIGDPYYTTANEEVYSIAETELATALEPYVIKNNLTAKIINDLITQQDTNVEKNTKETTSGKNSSSLLQQILQLLAGYVATISNKQKSIQLPVSVLNKDSITKSLQDFQKNMAEIQEDKKKAKDAAQPRQASASISISGMPVTVQANASVLGLYLTITGSQ